MNPIGSTFRCVFLVESFPSGTRRITGNYEGPFCEMRGASKGKT